MVTVNMLRTHKGKGSSAIKKIFVKLFLIKSNAFTLIIPYVRDYF